MNRQTKSNWRRLSAFTLVEMLIVVGIVGILLGMGAGALVAVSQGSGLKQAETAVVGKLNAARSLAASQNTYIAVVFPSSSRTPDDLAARCLTLCEVEASGTTGSKIFKPKAVIPGQSWVKLPSSTLVLSKVTEVGTDEATGTLITTRTDGFVTFNNTPAASAPKDEDVRLSMGSTDYPESTLPAIVFGPSGQPETDNLTGIILYVAEGRLLDDQPSGNLRNYRLIGVNPFTGRVKTYGNLDEVDDETSL